MTTFTKSDEAVLGVSAAVLGLTAVIALSVVWGGFWGGLALSVLWGWFVVPLFGLPALSTWQAYGLILVFRTMQAHTQAQKNTDGLGEMLAKSILGAPFIAGLFLLVGWFVKAWV